MFQDGWRLIVSSPSRLDAQGQWERWLSAQPTPPDPDDTRADVDAGPDGELFRYWVRGDLLLARADRVIVVKGNYDPRRRKNNEILGQTSDPTRIAELFDALATTICEWPSWMQWATPTIAFVSGRSELIGTVSIVGGDLIRSELWSGDAPLVKPEALSAWLAQTLGS